MTKKVPVSTIVPFGLRLQPELKARLEAEAALNNRSLNAEIAERLEMSLTPPAENQVTEQSAELLAENKKLRREMTRMRTLMRIRQIVPDRPSGQADGGKDATAPKLLFQMLEVTEETEKLRKEVGEVLEIVKTAMTPDELKRRFGRGPGYDEPPKQQPEAAKTPPKRTPPSKKSPGSKS
ncbi:hypothetical protein LGM43_26625 [Burkholderia seminalis]|uniref:hypothetical protein n=1 Tax=Burkholderia seminalis TaxID=488731 RepID=UPI001CF3CE17|nr:hypothetical protein [Burkholderia seminalis]MCA7953848.1 hypothetical protein [Burkholderia seminalis]